MPSKGSLLESKRKWKRRERAMFLGVLLWTAAVGAMLTFRNDVILAFLESSGSVEVFGVLLFTLGVFGGIGDGVMVLFYRWRFGHEVDPSELYLEGE